MITLTGVEGSPEYGAAKKIAAAFQAYWPGLADSPVALEDLRIAANVKVPGYKTSDIDVVVCGRFRAGRKFAATRSIKSVDGESCGTSPIAVYNLAIAVEVKSHPPDGIRFDGETVRVQYTRNGVSDWHDATGQNEKQLFTLQEYFDARHITGWIYRVIFLDGLHSRQTPAGVLSAEFKAADFLTELASISPPRKGKSGLYLSSFGNDDDAKRAIDDGIFRQIVPSNLDRKKMDRIASQRVTSAEWYEGLGKEMLIFRGRGGTGKTILLLQLAHKKYRDLGARCLLVTYNHSLAADIRRSMALMNVPSSPDGGGIAVQSVMSLVLSWLNSLGVLDGEDAEQLIELDEYPALCKQALELFEEGVVTEEDVLAAKRANRERLDFDYVMVDEGQDWPHEEANLICWLYPMNRFVVADGFDQLIRGKRTDWSKIGAVTESRDVIPLRRCLRMKRNLARFANAVASRAGLGWEVEPNDKAGGGKIIVLEGPYLANNDLHKELLVASEAAGNQPVDLLFCVPPSNLLVEGNSRRSELARQLSEFGWEVWDGTDAIDRRDFARSIGMHRVVQFESCRGLEGWVVVAEDLDEFWAHKKSLHEPGSEEADLYKSSDDLAAEAAWRWCLMAMTRPIDTMVITLSDPQSVPGKLLREVSRDLPDIVEWRSN